MIQQPLFMTIINIIGLHGTLGLLLGVTYVVFNADTMTHLRPQGLFWARTCIVAINVMCAIGVYVVCTYLKASFFLYFNLIVMWILYWWNDATNREHIWLKNTFLRVPFMLASDRNKARSAKFNRLGFVPPHKIEEDQKEAFLTRLRRWAEERYEFVVNKLKTEPERQGDLYKVSRIMFVPHYQIRDWAARRSVPLNPNSGSSWSRNGCSLGLHWTYDLDGWNGDDDAGARAVWANTNAYIGAELLIESWVPASSIDWPTTIMSNMDYFSGDPEREIRLLKGAPVKVEEIIIWDAKNISKAGPDYFDFKFDEDGDLFSGADTITFVA